MPHVLLVDIPRLIANATKGITNAGRKMLAEIIDHYISSGEMRRRAFVSL
jgi:hypothetical protein